MYLTMTVYKSNFSKKKNHWYLFSAQVETKESEFLQTTYFKEFKEHVTKHSAHLETV